MSIALTMLLVLLVPFVELFFAGSQIAALSQARLIYAIALILIVSKHPRVGITLILVGTLFVELAAFRPIAGLEAMAFFLAAALTTVMFRFSSALSKENTYLQGSIIFILSLIMQLSVISILVNSVILILALFIHGRLKQPENAFKN